MLPASAATGPPRGAGDPHAHKEGEGFGNRDTHEGPPVLVDGRALVSEPVRRAHEWWRWRELNPRPLTVNQDFSGCSALWIFSAPALARTRPLTGPVE